MDFSTFYQDFTKKRKMPLPPDNTERVEASLAVQVHTTGARPSFTNPKYGYVEPAAYDKRFEKIFATKLLNRHPNENDHLYNWRLSIYAPVAKELYDRFLTMCRGTILQPNSYDLSVDDRTQEYIGGSFVHDTLFKGIDFILQNPYGHMAVLESQYEMEPGDPLRPHICFVSADDLIMKDDDSIAFKHKGNVYFLDRYSQWVIKGKETFEFKHNLDVVPAWEIDNNFIEPFVAWADLLVRNMNDDEMMSKQYSYPTRQSVREACNAPKCIGGIVTDMTDPLLPVKKNCTSCNGTGIKTFNPGDDLTISESTLKQQNWVMPQMMSYVTPPVEIPQYHLDRWQVFYDRTEKSLCLNKKINATESGDAKREDRKDQYFYLMTISNFVFKQLERGLEYISAYKNYNQESRTFKNQEVVLIPPNQFDLMTDSDLVLEFADLQNKTDDSQLLSEMQYHVNRRIWRNDPVQLMINDILYYTDPLYGVAGNALKSKLLSGVFDEKDKIVHEKGYKILLGISREMTPKVFAESDVNSIMARFDKAIVALQPKGIYSDVMGVNGNTLKDSVGGLTGMIEIAKAVASGLYDLDAAIALVSDRFGISEEDARRLLGTPSISGDAAVEKVATLT